MHAFGDREGGRRIDRPVLGQLRDNAGQLVDPGEGRPGVASPIVIDGIRMVSDKAAPGVPETAGPG